MRSLGTRRVRVLAGDTLIINGYEVSADILREIIASDKRLLWAFVRSATGRNIQPVPFSEDRVIWLTDGDLVREPD